MQALPKGLHDDAINWLQQAIAPAGPLHPRDMTFVVRRLRTILCFKVAYYKARDANFRSLLCDHPVLLLEHLQQVENEVTNQLATQKLVNEGAQQVLSAENDVPVQSYEESLQEYFARAADVLGKAARNEATVILAASASNILPLGTIQSVIRGLADPGLRFWSLRRVMHVATLWTLHRAYGVVEDMARILAAEFDAARNAIQCDVSGTLMAFVCQLSPIDSILGNNGPVNNTAEHTEQRRQSPSTSLPSSEIIPYHDDSSLRTQTSLQDTAGLVVNVPEGTLAIARQLPSVHYSTQRLLAEPLVLPLPSITKLAPWFSHEAMQLAITFRQIEMPGFVWRTGEKTTATNLVDATAEVLQEVRNRQIANHTCVAYQCNPLLAPAASTLVLHIPDREVLVDPGSTMNLLFPALQRQADLPSYPIEQLGFEPLTITMQNGLTSTITHWSHLYVKLGVVRRTVFVFLCPLQLSDVALVLGAPYLDSIPYYRTVEHGYDTLVLGTFAETGSNYRLIDRRQSILAKLNLPEIRRNKTLALTGIMTDQVLPPCRCKTDCLCLVHQIEIFDVDAGHNQINYIQDWLTSQTTIRRRDLDNDILNTSLTAWFRQTGIQLGPRIPKEDLDDVLRTFWTYRDLDLCSTREEISSKGGQQPWVDPRRSKLPLYRAKARSTAPTSEWFHDFAIDGLDTGLFEIASSSNNGNLRGREFQSGNAIGNATLSCYLFEETPMQQMTQAIQTRRYLSQTSHTYYSELSLENWCWPIHPEDRHELAVFVPGVGLIQPRRLCSSIDPECPTVSQFAKKGFGPIKGHFPEPTMLGDEDGTTALHNMVVYLNKAFAAHGSWYTHWNFIKNELLPRISWLGLKLPFRHIKLGNNIVRAVGTEYFAEGRLSVSPSRKQRMKAWPEPRTKIELAAFLEEIQSMRMYVKNFSELARPLTDLCSVTQPWRWNQVHKLAFILLRNKITTQMYLRAHDLCLPVHMHLSHSETTAGCVFLQHIDSSPIRFDSFELGDAFNDPVVGRRELKIILSFINRNPEYFRAPGHAIVWSKHLFKDSRTMAMPPGGLLADIYQQLRSLNVTLQPYSKTPSFYAHGLAIPIFNRELTDTNIVATILRQASPNDRQETSFFMEFEGVELSRLLNELIPANTPGW